MVGTPWSQDVDRVRGWLPLLDVGGVALCLPTSNMDGVEDSGVVRRLPLSHVDGMWKTLILLEVDGPEE